MYFHHWGKSPKCWRWERDKALSLNKAFTTHTWHYQPQAIWWQSVTRHYYTRRSSDRSWTKVRQPTSSTSFSKITKVSQSHKVSVLFQLLQLSVPLLWYIHLSMDKLLRKWHAPQFNGFIAANLYRLQSCTPWFQVWFFTILVYLNRLRLKYAYVRLGSHPSP